MAQPTLQYPPQADPAWQIEEHDGVARREAEIECTAVVPIHDPALATQEGFDFCPPLGGRRGIPAGAPVQCVEMNEWQSRALGEASREGRLPGATAADDENALQFTFSTASMKLRLFVSTQDSETAAMPIVPSRSPVPVGGRPFHGACLTSRCTTIPCRGS